MPYIDPDRRKDLDPFLKSICEAVVHVSEGEMNYVLSRLMLAHVTHDGLLKPSYADYEAAIGLLECVKLELYRRAVAVYEDRKVRENGDVFV